MCGINGIINLNFLEGDTSIRKMNDELQHRGPDAEGVFNSSNIFLGHRRLSIIDLSTGANQPFIAKNHNGHEFTMVYNGEVYNFEELREKHQLDCSTKSDTEVILKAFIKIGPAIFKELNGMFSLAIYNKHDNSVCIARDRLGIKPLFIFQANQGLAFSSELNGLKCIPEIKSQCSINKKAISSFLHLGYIPSPLSIYNEVQKFPSGSYGIYKDGKLITASYWSVKSKLTPEVLKDEKAAISKLDNLLNDSVKLRLKCDVPFGTFLSGGVDSSIVTAIAQKNSSQNINSFSIGFKEKSHNEALYAKQVADKLSTNHNEFIVSEKEAMKLIPDMFASYGEPYADSSAIPTMMVAKLAGQKVKMTLSGDGGDELFHGYGFYSWAARLQQPLIKTFRKPIAAVLKKGDQRMKRASNMFTYPKGEMQSHLFSQEQYLFTGQEIKELMEDKFSSFPTELNTATSNVRIFTPAEKQSLFDINYYLKDDLLTKVDIATMKQGLETRVPLLDHNIVEFALNLSPDLKTKNGEQKYILKQLLYQYLPKEIFDRPKQGFSIPLASWLKGDLNYLIKDYLNQTIIEQHDIVNWAGVQTLLNKFYKGEDYLYTRIWALIVLHQWLSNN
jgi:asparagine synthase (glutamine-hydrolysing)